MKTFEEFMSKIELAKKEGGVDLSVAEDLSLIGPRSLLEKYLF